MLRVEGAPLGGGGRSEMLPTEAGAAAIEGATSDDILRFQYEATNIIFDCWFDLMVNTFSQSDDTITMTYGLMNLDRTIFLDGAHMPDDYTPNLADKARKLGIPVLKFEKGA